MRTEVIAKKVGGNGNENGNENGNKNGNKQAREKFNRWAYARDCFQEKHGMTVFALGKNLSKEKKQAIKAKCRNGDGNTVCISVGQPFITKVRKCATKTDVEALVMKKVTNFSKKNAGRNEKKNGDAKKTSNNIAKKNNEKNAKKNKNKNKNNQNKNKNDDRLVALALEDAKKLAVAESNIATAVSMFEEAGVEAYFVRGKGLGKLRKSLMKDEDAKNTLVFGQGAVNRVTKMTPKQVSVFVQRKVKQVAGADAEVSIINSNSKEANTGDRKKACIQAFKPKIRASKGKIAALKEEIAQAKAALKDEQTSLKGLQQEKKLAISVL